MSEIGVSAYRMGESFLNETGTVNNSSSGTLTTASGGYYGVDSSGLNVVAPTQVNATGHQSEALAFDFNDQTVTTATVSLSNLYQTENGGESARWFAFDADGNQVASGIISSNSEGAPYADSTEGVTWHNGHQATFTISDIGGFSTLAFDTVPYAQDGHAANDDSDYFVKVDSYEVAPTESGEYEDVFTYTLTDGDGDQAPATLTINGDAATGEAHAYLAPVAVDNNETVDEAATLEGNVITDDDDDGGAASGRDWDADTPVVDLVINTIAPADGSTQAIQVNGSTVITTDYGTLTLNPDGSYTYVANGRASQTLEQGETAVDSFTYTLRDPQGNVSEGASLNITINGITGIPTASPVLSVSGGGEVPEGEDAQFTVSLNEPQDEDLDVTLEITHGTTDADDLGEITVSYDNGGTPVEITANEDGSYTVPAGVTELNVSVPAVDDSSVEGSENFTLKASSTVAGSDTADATILDNDIANEAPVAAQGAVEGTEDTQLVLNWSDFNVTDTDSDIADLGIYITSLPADGVLQYQNEAGDWVEITAADLGSDGFYVAQSDIAAGKLAFMPDEHESGYDGYNEVGIGNNRQDYARFEFKPHDGQATGEAAILNIDIQPVADAPTITLTEGTVERVAGKTVITQNGETLIVIEGSGEDVNITPPDGGSVFISPFNNGNINPGSDYNSHGADVIAFMGDFRYLVNANPSTVQSLNGHDQDIIYLSGDRDDYNINLGQLHQNSGYDGIITQYHADGTSTDLSVNNIRGFVFGDGSTELFFDNLESTYIAGGEQVELLLTAELVDTDGSEALSAINLSGIPDGVTIEGAEKDGDTWVVTDLAQASGGSITLTATVPEGTGSFDITAELVSTEQTSGDTANRTVTLSYTPESNSEETGTTAASTASRAAFATGELAAVGSEDDGAAASATETKAVSEAEEDAEGNTESNAEEKPSASEAVETEEKSGTDSLSTLSEEEENGTDGKVAEAEERSAAESPEAESEEEESAGNASEDEEADEFASLLYDGEELTFESTEESSEEEAEPTGEEPSSSDENPEATGAEEEETLALHEVLPEEDSVDNLLGESDAESGEEEQESGRESGTETDDVAAIVSIDTGASLDNLTGGNTTTSDM